MAEEVMRYFSSDVGKGLLIQCLLRERAEIEAELDRTMTPEQKFEFEQSVVKEGSEGFGRKWREKRKA